MEVVGAFVLRVALVLSIFAAAHADGAGGDRSARNLSGTKPLPPGACYWRQGSLINGPPTGATEPFGSCRFEVRDPEFLDLLGPSPKVVQFVTDNAHEGGVWYPNTNEFYYTSNRFEDSKNETETQLKKVNLTTGAVTVLSAPSGQVPNGLALDNEGNLLVCQQGNETQGGFIQRINLKTQATSVVADNWFGVPFNSPNDVVTKSDGSIWFTDPSYGFTQGFRSPPKVNNQVYRISVTGVVDAVADGFSQPNGLAFSPDEKRLYVTDTGFAVGPSGQYDVTKPHSILSFDVRGDGRLINRQLFASVGVYDGSSPGLGIPDGIKVDTMGRVYTASVDGIQVLVIRVPQCSTTRGRHWASSVNLECPTWDLQARVWALCTFLMVQPSLMSRCRLELLGSSTQACSCRVTCEG